MTDKDINNILEHYAKVWHKETDVWYPCQDRKDTIVHDLSNELSVSFDIAYWMLLAQLDREELHTIKK